MSLSLLSKKVDYEVEVLQEDKFNCICCFAQRRTYGLQGRHLLERFFKNRTVNCLTLKKIPDSYIRTTSAFCALALFLHGNQNLEEETYEKFKLFEIRLDGLSPNQFQGVHMNDISIVEYRLLLNFLFHDIDNVEKNIVSENLLEELGSSMNFLKDCSDATTLYAI